VITNMNSFKLLHEGVEACCTQCISKCRASDVTPASDFKGCGSELASLQSLRKLLLLFQCLWKVKAPASYVAVNLCQPSHSN
jgi:hypothetical protein